LLSPSPKAGTGNALSRNGDAATEQISVRAIAVPRSCGGRCDPLSAFYTGSNDDLFATERSGAM
jgi:hypothetical protein